MHDISHCFALKNSKVLYICHSFINFDLELDNIMFKAIAELLVRGAFLPSLIFCLSA